MATHRFHNPKVVDSNLTPATKEIKGACHSVHAPHFGTLWRQCKTLGFQPKLVMAIRAHLFYTDVVAWGGDLPLGVTGDVWWTPNIKDSPGIGGTTPQSLTARWTEETGQALNVGIGAGYPSIQVLIDAIERAGTLDGDAINLAFKTGIGAGGDSR